MQTIYTSGEYLASTGDTWHAEDAPWKSGQILKMLRRHQLTPARIAEIGCGAGQILAELAKAPELAQSAFEGWDISPQAIQIAQRNADARRHYCCGDMTTMASPARFDLLMAIDVFEHVPDYMGFLTKLQCMAEFKLYHIPLDLHVQGVLRGSFLAGRFSVGHLHYFTAESALATLRDTGHEVVDSFYTNDSAGLWSQHPSARTAIANAPRWLLSRVSEALAARLLGGFSLMVLCR